MANAVAVGNEEEIVYSNVLLRCLLAINAESVVTYRTKIPKLARVN